MRHVQFSSLNVFDELGIPVAINKLEDSSLCLTFLGFELDSTAMEVASGQIGRAAEPNTDLDTQGFVPKE